MDSILISFLPMQERHVPDIMRWGLVEAQHCCDLHTGESSTRKAMDCFSERRGLDRSLEIAADLNNLEPSESLPSSPPLKASPAAAAYTAYLTSLAQRASESKDSTLSQQACLRCFLAASLSTTLRAILLPLDANKKSLHERCMYLSA